MVTNSVAGQADSHASRAIACMLIGNAILSLNDVFVKILTTGYPVGQILMLRGLFILPWVLLIAHFTGGLGALRIANLKGQSLRAACVVAASFFFVTGLAYLPLADLVAVSFTGPLFVTAMAPLALGEKVGMRRWLAVLIGFAGVLVMVRPGHEAVQLAILLPLAGAFCGSVRDLITRYISQTEASSAVLLFTTLAVILAGLVTTPFAWTEIRTADLGYFAASGVLVAVGQYLMIEAFRNGEAALVAPFKYSMMIWALLYGYLFFNHLPDGWTLFGAFAVVAAGLYIMRRETKLTNRPISAGPRPPSRL